MIPQGDISISHRLVISWTDFKTFNMQLKEKKISANYFQECILRINIFEKNAAFISINRIRDLS